MKKKYCMRKDDKTFDWLSIYLSLLFHLSSASAAQGIVSNLTLGKNILQDWTMYSLSIDQAVSQGLLGQRRTREDPRLLNLSLPTFYEGSFIIPDGIPDLPQDTYIRLPNWRKACHSHTASEFKTNLVVHCNGP